MSPDLEPQPIPKKARCPKCGGQPDPDAVEHRLQALGYLHDDQRLHCEDCGHPWTAGIPIGEFDRDDMSDAMWCGSCDTLMLVHWVDTRGTTFPSAGDVALGLKCPDPECRNFDIVGRNSDDRGVAMTGYDVLAGQTEGAEAYGYPEEVTHAHDE